MIGNRWMTVGRSTLPDSRHAGLEAVAGALSDGEAVAGALSDGEAVAGALSDGEATCTEPKLLLVFSSGRRDLPALLAAIREGAPGVPVVGCSTAGEIACDGPSEGGVVVTALGGDGFSVGTAVARRASTDPRTAGADIARCIDAASARAHKVLMLLVDGTTQEQEEIVRGVYSVVGASVPLVGGCAAEETTARATTQFYDTEILEDAAIAVAIGSDAPLGIGMSHGWRIAGDAMVVTGARKGRISTLDDRPALDVYLDRLGAPADAYQNPDEFQACAVTRPLGIRRRSGDAVRGIAGFPDFASRTLRFRGEITQGSLIWCMDGDARTMLDATDDACRQALAAIDDKPLGLLAFDCSGRRDVLGDEGVREEVRRLISIADGAPVSGFYSFGEIARTRGINGFHHQTLVVLAVA